MPLTDLVSHHMCALTRVVRILRFPISWLNTEERIETRTLLEGVSITNGKFSIAIYYETIIAEENCQTWTKERTQMQ